MYFINVGPFNTVARGDDDENYTRTLMNSFGTDCHQ